MATAYTPVTGGTAGYAGYNRGGLNYPGSSGFSYGTIGRQTQQNEAVDYGILDSASGRVVSLATGKPFNGKDPMTGKTFSNGVETASAGTDSSGRVLVPGTTDTYINPNDASARYKPVEIAKPSQAGVTEQASDTLKLVKQATTDSLADFKKYLSDAQGQASTALTATKAATDVGPLSDTLRGKQATYSGALGRDVSQMDTLNAQTAAAQNAIVQQGQDYLPLYDTAMNNANALAQAGVTNQMSRYGAGLNARSGATLGASGDIARLAAQESYKASQPYEMAKVNQRYNLLENLNLPVARDIANRYTTQYSQFQPQIQAAQFQTAQGTEQAIQTLKTSAASQDWQTVSQLLQVPQMAASVRQSILAGDTSLLGTIAQLESNGYYTGLQDLLGVNVSQPQSYNMGTGGYQTSQPRYPTQQAGGQGGGGGMNYQMPTQGSTATGTTSLGGGIAYKPIAVANNAGQTGNYVWGNQANYGSQSQSRYDPMSGQIVDQYGNPQGTGATNYNQTAADQAYMDYNLGMNY